ncbi:SDR family oxidoreductase [Actinoallomurus bryophytorum]|uniref:Nucleoside-diphosphate-sugar epimerase n=1 Tax=Actinoallomurus bryophytorum TaxID=1490222 RepID=A0A543CKH3_9ACTN|nr:SDR family oxidoreductase [Actinoallomurus bryophytorum]TQL97601.1 nucleoside-diphosphate-sugar epimerase [Actinoallomurus bryophytorum]
MRVFVTGASGHIGSAVLPELMRAGHQVVGLARSDASAEALAAAGAEVRRGDLDDLDGLREAAGAADGVIHLAFKHDLMATGDFAAAAAADFAAIKALASGLEGTDRPLVISSGTLLLARAGITGRPGTEADVIPGGPRVDAENFVIGLAGRGVRSSAVRLPPIVHSPLDHNGFVHVLVAIARQAGVSGYVGDGANRWPSVHTLDAARVYRLALESAPAGSRLHAVADEGVPFRDIAAAIGRGAGVPVAGISAEDAGERFAFLGPFVGVDNPVSSEVTRKMLGWEPANPGLIEDLGHGHYFGRG